MILDRSPDVTTITPASIRTLLVLCVQEALNYMPGRVIVENMNDRRPADKAPYASIWWKRTSYLSQNVGDFEASASGGVDQILHNECVITAQFSVYGKDAYAECTRLSNAIHSAQRFKDLWRVLGYAGQSPIQDISSFFAAQIQQRAYFDLDFYAFMGAAFKIDWFNTASILLATEAPESSDGLIYPIQHQIAITWDAEAYTLHEGKAKAACLLKIDGAPAGEGDEIIINIDPPALFQLWGNVRAPVFARVNNEGLAEIEITSAAPSGTTGTISGTNFDTASSARLIIGD